jgi:hypothetical protein
MATPKLVTVRDFTTSRFSQLADTTDASLTDILARAEAIIQSQLRRPILPTEFTERYRPKYSTIYLRRRPIISVNSVMKGTSLRWSGINTSIPASLYYVEPDLGYIEFEASVSGYIVDVTYTAGFTTVPEDLKEAIIQQAALLTFQDLEIYGSGDSKEPGIMYMKKDIASLLEPYKLLSLAYTE